MKKEEDKKEKKPELVKEQNKNSLKQYEVKFNPLNKGDESKRFVFEAATPERAKEWVEVQLKSWRTPKRKYTLDLFVPPKPIEEKTETEEKQEKKKKSKKESVAMKGKKEKTDKN